MNSLERVAPTPNHSITQKIPEQQSQTSTKWRIYGTKTIEPENRIPNNINSSKDYTRSSIGSRFVDTANNLQGNTSHSYDFIEYDTIIKDCKINSKHDVLINYIYEKIYSIDKAQDTSKILTIVQLITEQLAQSSQLDLENTTEYSKLYVILYHFVESDMDKVIGILNNLLNKTQGYIFLDLKFKYLFIENNTLKPIIAYLQLLIKIFYQENKFTSLVNNHSKSLQLLSLSLKHMEEILSDKDYNSTLTIAYAAYIKDIIMNFNDDDKNYIIKNIIFNNSLITEKFKIYLAMLMKNANHAIEPNIFAINDTNELIKKSKEDIEEFSSYINIINIGTSFDQELFDKRLAAIKNITPNAETDQAMVFIKISSLYDYDVVLSKLAANKDILNQIIKSKNNDLKTQLILLLFDKITTVRLTEDQAALALDIMRSIVSGICKIDNDENTYQMIYQILFSLTKYKNISIFNILKLPDYNKFSKQIFLSNNDNLIQEYLTFFAKIASTEQNDTNNYSNTAFLLQQVLVDITNLLKMNNQTNCCFANKDIGKAKACWFASKIANILEQLNPCERRYIADEFFSNNEISLGFKKRLFLFMQHKKLDTSTINYKTSRKTQAEVRKYINKILCDSFKEINAISKFIFYDEIKTIQQVDDDYLALQKNNKINSILSTTANLDQKINDINNSFFVEDMFLFKNATENCNKLIYLLYNKIQQKTNDKSICNISARIITGIDNMPNYCKSSNLYGKVYHLLSLYAVKSLSNTDAVIELFKSMISEDKNLNDRFTCSIDDNDVVINNYISLIVNISKKSETRAIILMETVMPNFIDDLSEPNINYKKAYFLIDSIFSIKTNESYKRKIVDKILTNPNITDKVKNMLFVCAKNNNMELTIEIDEQLEIRVTDAIDLVKDRIKSDAIMSYT